MNDLFPSILLLVFLETNWRQSVEAVFHFSICFTILVQPVQSSIYELHAWFPPVVNTPPQNDLPPKNLLNE